MNGLKTPRDMVFDSQGNLLIVEQDSAGVRLVKLTDGGGTSVCVASSKQLIADSSVCVHILCEGWKRLHGLKLRNSLSQEF